MDLFDINASDLHIGGLGGLNDFLIRAACKLIQDEYEETTVETVGLEERAGHRIWIAKDYGSVAVNNYIRRALDYYGGFEYVDKGCVRVIGEYTFYLSEGSRVAEAIEIYSEKK